MGRTFEVLGGRPRRTAGAEPVAAIPFPQPDPEPEANVELVPVGAAAPPPDAAAVPHVEAGLGTRGVAAAPHLLPPNPVAAQPVSSVAFQLLPGPARTRSSPAEGLIAYPRPEPPPARQYRRLV